ncbi:hypothetical protein Nham_1367 [Nitrobacter hamburgensis X14]|uniref:Uncharacterized protein n=1 Tax=Nitrobacter hamburgensis (strain DSM 10229 / NCIMB 13809 / X14) TaxID=323097 RepID=Q1QNK6_NITHX|nr:hypothetical protein [Nitrobacter hamburgensis]ABE62191.1 hypothetical protein Nham_1367 [Nitrobacter hamburgensis X14]
MQVAAGAASDLVDRFEELLAKHSISVPRHAETGADMLPFRSILDRLKAGFSGTPDDLRTDYTAAIAVHDLAAKVLQVKDHPRFRDLLPHLEILAKGAIHLTEPPPAYPDGYNKLIEVYWACLALSAGLTIDLDHPTDSTGRNPDVITSASTRPSRHGYAFKTIRSPYAQSILTHLEKGVDQIQRSNCSESIVALHLTPRLQSADIWPAGGSFLHWGQPAIAVASACHAMLTEVVTDNGMAKIDDIFRGTKVAGVVLCLGFCPTVAINPLTGRPTMMPLKVATLVEISQLNPLSGSFFSELTGLNHQMQTVLG